MTTTILTDDQRDLIISNAPTMGDICRDVESAVLAALVHRAGLEAVAHQLRYASDDGTWSAWVGCDKPYPALAWREPRNLYPPEAIAQLQATIESLSAEVERLTADRDEWRFTATTSIHKVAELRAQLEAQGEAVDEQRAAELYAQVFGVELTDTSQRGGILRLCRLAATHPAPAAPVVEPTQADAELLAQVLEQFDDCGETDVGDDVLMRFVSMGLLECTCFEATPKGTALAATVDAPLFALHPTQPKGEKA